MDCIFCKIIKKELPGDVVFENDKMIAFLDINPINFGHTLVVPKGHVENLFEMEDDDLREVILGIKKVAKGIVSALDVKGFNVGQNHGEVAGQIVPHLHWHVIPRLAEDNLGQWPAKSYSKGEKEEIANKIRENI